MEFKLKEWVARVTDAVKNQYVVDTKTSKSITVNTGAVQPANVSASKTGYTPIGIVGITKAVVGAGNVNAVVITQYYINGSTASAIFYNASAADHTMTVTFYILYRKNYS